MSHMYLPDGNTVDLTSETPTKAQLLQHEVGRCLSLNYSGYHWVVGVSADCSIVKIMNEVSRPHNFVIHTTQIQNDPVALRREVVRAGGEILERFNLPRRKACQEKLLAMPKNFAGIYVGDRSR